ncbi:MAG: VIT1/CCC1 transporter family protein [Candidatus Paceibacterota bacterium]|jgi:VIT1/CCC1 family predicted Fe2+/Mn2+ transporter
MEIHKKINKDYIHHQKSSLTNVFREVVFGMEDGMVSTLGSITGIAIGSNNQATVILAGVVIISVESISMGIGSYLSNRSQEELEQRKIKEEKEELEKFPEEEKEELYQIYLKDGWSKDLAVRMSEEVSGNHELILKEMIMHELKISGDQESVSIKGGFYMFFAYILGGIVPLFAYLVLSIKNAVPLSIAITLIGLFALGMSTTKFTKQPILKSGMRVLIMGGIALFAGLLAGVLIGQ